LTAGASRWRTPGCFDLGGELHIHCRSEPVEITRAHAWAFQSSPHISETHLRALDSDLGNHPRLQAAVPDITMSKRYTP
jgi:hypothetical protein